jgi:hypothetical protein
VTGAVSAALALRSALEHQNEDLVKGFMLLTEAQRESLAAALAVAVFSAAEQWPDGRPPRED